MSKSNKQNTTTEQFNLMKDFMSKHPSAAKGYKSEGVDKTQVDLEWLVLVEKLDSMGPPYRSMSQWRKVWTDYRNRSIRQTRNKIPLESESGDELLLRITQQTEKSKKHSTSEQLDIIKDFMCSHPCAAKGYSAPGISRAKVDEEWLILFEKLNAIGPPYRTISQWRKVWTDYRGRLKRKIINEFYLTSDSADMTSEHGYDDEISSFSTNTLQMENLKHFMSEHPAAAGYVCDANNSQVDDEWEELCILLNSLGPPHRSIEEWKEFWRDSRKRLQQRLSEYHLNSETEQSEEDGGEHVYVTIENCSTDSNVLEDDNPVKTTTSHNTSQTEYNIKLNENLQNNATNPEEEDNVESASDNSNIRIQRDEHAMEQTLSTLHNQMDQQIKLMQYLTRISNNITNVVDRYVGTLERKNELLERQLNATKRNNYLMRRQACRRRSQIKGALWNFDY